MSVSVCHHADSLSTWLLKSWFPAGWRTEWVQSVALYEKNSSLLLFLLLPSCSCSVLFFLPLLSPHAHGWSLLLYSFHCICLCLSFMPFSASITFSIPLPMPWINSIVYYTILCLVPQGEEMPLHGPAETTSSPIPHHTSIELISSLFVYLWTHQWRSIYCRKESSQKWLSPSRTIAPPHRVRYYEALMQPCLLHSWF